MSPSPSATERVRPLRAKRFARRAKNAGTVAGNMQDILRITQQTTEGTKQTSASVEELAKLAGFDAKNIGATVAEYNAGQKSGKVEVLQKALLQAYEGDAPLSMHELQNVMHQLISAGYETVKSALAHGMWQMVRFPEVVEEVRSDRSLLHGFINESLRWESPVQGLWRIVKQDVEVAGTTIPKGALCSVRFGAGNSTCL